MVLRQNSARRRRIVIDPNNQGTEAGHSSDELSVSHPPRKKRTLYKSGAERRHQWKTTDLFPKRPWGISITVALLLLSLVAVNALHFYSGRWLNYLGASGIAALQLTGRATLAAWFSSFLLIISGFASLQIYALRQHRQDDYRGSYRLWLWIAGILLLASVNCIVDLTAIACNVVHCVTQFSMNSSLLSVIGIKLLLLTGLIARGSLEVRESRSALVLVVLVWVAYAAAATLRLPQLQPVLSNIDQQTLDFTQGNLMLFGTVILFLAHLVFARFVYLQALGMIKPRAAKKSKKKSKTRKQSQASKAKSLKKTAAEDAGESDTEADDRQTKDQSEKSSREKSADQKRDATMSPTGVGGSSTPKVSPLSKYAPEKPNRQKSDSAEEVRQDEQEVYRLSKSEQRRQRKQQQHRRAA